MFIIIIIIIIVFCISKTMLSFTCLSYFLSFPLFYIYIYIRCEQLGIKLFNFHPGSTVGGCTKKESIEYIAAGLLEKSLRWERKEKEKMC